MNSVVHFLEPSRLLLIWQPLLSGNERRTRRVVGEIVRQGEQITFQYLQETKDYKSAKEEGFLGYPSFKETTEEYKNDVLASFLCRLPPKKRGDFADFLSMHGLPSDFDASDFSLLAHTRAKLPGDGFEILPDLTTVKKPYDLIIEVAGTRHIQSLAFDQIKENAPVFLKPENSNLHDENAIEVICEPIGQLGYIPKPYCQEFQKLIETDAVTCVIQKVNGRPERRLIYLFLQVR